MTLLLDNAGDVTILTSPEPALLQLGLNWYGLCSLELPEAVMTRKPTTKDNDIDYTAEGNDPGTSKPPDPTDRGYDQAANRGDKYGVREGDGGVFGTTGGGTYGGGMHTEERPLIDNNAPSKRRKK